MMVETVGVARFIDLDSRQLSAIQVSRLPEGGVALFMDQNDTAESGWGGDCEVGFNSVAMSQFLDRLREAMKVAGSVAVGSWEAVGSVKYTWCHQDDAREDRLEGPGQVSFFGGGRTRPRWAWWRRSDMPSVRIVVSPKWEWEPYSFALPLDAAEALVNLLKSAPGPLQPQATGDRP